MSVALNKLQYFEHYHCFFLIFIYLSLSVAFKTRTFGKKESNLSVNIHKDNRSLCTVV